MIGTTEIQLKRISNNNLKLTNLTHVQVEKKKTNIWLEILKIIGIGIVATAAAALGQAWASAGLIALGASEATITIASIATSSFIEFGVMEGYDALTGNVTAEGTALNALPFLKVIKAVPQGIRLSKIFELAESTGLFKELNLTDKEIKNFGQLTKILKNKNIVNNQMVYNFADKKTAKSVLLKLLSDKTATKGIHIGATNIKNTGKVLSDEFNELLELQGLLEQVSPNLFPKVRSDFYNQAKDILEEGKYSKKELLNDDIFGKIVLSARSAKGNKSASVVWALYSIRQTIKIENELSKRLLFALKKVNYAIEKINPVYWIKKTLSKIISELDHGIKKIIKHALNTNVAKTIKSKFEPVVEQINKIKNMDIKKVINNASEEIDKLLIPVSSDWILGYKFKKVFSEYTVSIYFKNPKYEPRIFNWSTMEFKSWLDACASGSVGSYYKKNLELGYHLKMSAFSAILHLAPPIITNFVKETIKTYKEYIRLKKMANDIKSGSYYGQAYNQVLSYLKNRTITWAASTLFTSSIFRSVFTNFVNGKDNKKYFEDVIYSKYQKTIMKKIPSISKI